MGKPGPVVIGFDETPSAWDALDWAAAEVATRGCPLAIINACSPPVAPGPFAPVFGLDGGGGDVSTVLLRQGEKRVRLITPDIKVTSRTVVGGAAPPSPHSPPSCSWSAPAASGGSAARWPAHRA